MTTDPTLTELLTRVKVVEEAPLLIRQIQVKLERVVKQHLREISLISINRKSRKRKP
jgi:hypothetical protein